MALVLGVDVGTTSVRVVLAGLNGQIVGEHVEFIETHHPGDDFWLPENFKMKIVTLFLEVSIIRKHLGRDSHLNKSGFE